MDKADKDLDAQLNENSYDESQLVRFKVPITMLSYYNPSAEWERVEGSIEVGNVYYKYVKRRIIEDSLEVLCIPNSTAMKLLAVKRQGSGHPVSSKLPVQEPYVFTSFCSIAPLSYKLVKATYYFSQSIPCPPKGVHDRPPAHQA